MISQPGSRSWLKRRAKQIAWAAVGSICGGLSYVTAFATTVFGPNLRTSYSEFLVANPPIDISIFVVENLNDVILICTFATVSIFGAVVAVSVLKVLSKQMQEAVGRYIDS